MSLRSHTFLSLSLSFFSHSRRTALALMESTITTASASRALITIILRAWTSTNVWTIHATRNARPASTRWGHSYVPTVSCMIILTANAIAHRDLNVIHLDTVPMWMNVRTAVMSVSLAHSVWTCRVSFFWNRKPILLLRVHRLRLFTDASDRFVSL